MVSILRSITNVCNICQPVWPSSSVQVVLVRQLLFLFRDVIASGSLMFVTLCSPVCVLFILNKCQFVTEIEAKRRGTDLRVP
jgi:hypothetical protein